MEDPTQVFIGILPSSDLLNQLLFVIIIIIQTIGPHVALRPRSSHSQRQDLLGTNAGESYAWGSNLLSL